jgi:heptosyltransferase I
VGFDALELSPPDRILAVKLSSFGDIIHVTPSLRALRQAFPQAEILLAVESRWAEAVRHNPNLNGLIECSSQVSLSPAYLWEVRRLLAKAGPFDMALDFQGTRRSAAWVYLSGAPIKAGRGEKRPGWKSAAPSDRTRHAVKLCARVCLDLGIPVPSLDPEIFLSQEDERSLDAILHAAGLPAGGFVLLNPFSRWPSKDWPDIQSAAVGERIASELGAAVVISGGLDERPRGEALLRRMAPSRAVSLAGALSLGQALCLFRRARLMISCDSGPMHAAAALGTPVLALFGPTHPEHSGPWGAIHWVLQASRPLHHHAYRAANASHYMQALDPNAIFEAAREMLAPTPVSAVAPDANFGKAGQ